MFTYYKNNTGIFCFQKRSSRSRSRHKKRLWLSAPTYKKSAPEPPQNLRLQAAPAPQHWLELNKCVAAALSLRYFKQTKHNYTSQCVPVNS